MRAGSVAPSLYNLQCSCLPFSWSACLAVAVSHPCPTVLGPVRPGLVRRRSIQGRLWRTSCMRLMVDGVFVSVFILQAGLLSTVLTSLMKRKTGGRQQEVLLVPDSRQTGRFVWMFLFTAERSEVRTVNGFGVNRQKPISGGMSHWIHIWKTLWLFYFDVWWRFQIKVNKKFVNEIHPHKSVINKTKPLALMQRHCYFPKNKTSICFRYVFFI